MTEPNTGAPVIPEPLAVLLREGVLDAELAALLWLTVEGGIPLVVAGEAADKPSAVRDALVDLRSADGVLQVLAGPTEDFAWMPEAVELGWRREGPLVPAARQTGAPGPVIQVADLAPGSASGTWGDTARVAIRALSLGYSMAATAGGDRLEDVLGRLAAFPTGALDDELTRLGVVLILGRTVAAERRVTAAHYLRPVARDTHGHVQRLAPAVLATWNATTGRFDHFSWGVVGELAGRLGRRPVDLEREQAHRAGLLAQAIGG